MDTGDGPKDNNGKFRIEGDLEKGSEANVTEDGGNNMMTLDFHKLFNGLDDIDNTPAAEQWTLDQWMAESSDGNTYAMSQGEPVPEEMLNMQSSVVEGILAPPASTFLGGCSSAVQTVRRERPAPNRVEIKVHTRRSQTDKRTQYKFHVDPDEDVASLRVLLANKAVDLPLNYHFYYNMGLMNESCSFRYHNIDGVEVPTIQVMDAFANSQLIILEPINSQDDHETQAAKKKRNV